MSAIYKEAAAKLLARIDLSREEAAAVMHEIMDGKLASSQAGAFLALLAAKGETGAELAGFAGVMRERATRVNAGEDLLDTCGTGGSGFITTNTSTIAAFIVAAAGIKVAKHGNRASSGRCGSMDVLEALGVPIDLGPREVELLIDRAGIAFMFAPKFHPAVANVAAVRRELGFRTTFNFLGPLANPAGATLQVLGVSDRRRAALMIDALRLLGSKRVMIVHGADGLDEITLTGPTHVWSLAGGAVEESQLTPDMVGLEPVDLARLAGGDPAENARIFIAVLEGTETGPIRDLAAINAAAALIVAGRAANLRDGFTAALELLREGRALAVFERYREQAKRARAPGAS